ASAANLADRLSHGRLFEGRERVRVVIVHQRPAVVCGTDGVRTVPGRGHRPTKNRARYPRKGARAAARVPPVCAARPRDRRAGAYSAPEERRHAEVLARLLRRRRVPPGWAAARSAGPRAGLLASALPGRDVVR